MKDCDNYLRHIDEANKNFDDVLNYSSIRDELQRWQIKKESDKKSNIEEKVCASFTYISYYIGIFSVSIS